MTAENINAINLASFSNAVNGMKAGIKHAYDRGVNRDLSQQQYQDVFRRNVTRVLREIYQQALAKLQQLTLEKESVGSEQSKEKHNDLCTMLLQSFDGVIEELILYALHKHRSSCALSNFPAEHNPGADYITEVIEEASRDWSAFAQQVNNMVAR
jgi:monoamine oxidase